MFADYAIRFNKALGRLPEKLKIVLPQGYQFANPFAQGQALTISTDFYKRFYQDKGKRRILLGINPGRHGAGLTGVPFADSKRLEYMGIDTRGIESYETSAEFVYKVVEAFGGAEAFYKHFYINSPLPLGLLHLNLKNNWVNANYYDSKALTRSVEPLINHAMKHYRQMPLDFSVAYCLGVSENYQYVRKWNETHRLFGKIVALAHPRYVMQYKRRKVGRYIEFYLQQLNEACYEAR